MSGVIDFLERMGRDAQLRQASEDDLAVALLEAQIEASLGAAIIAKSTSELYALLHQGPMFHVQMDPGKEEEDEEEDDDGEGKPSPESKVRVEPLHADRIATAVT
ncbi:hypothetical protein ISN76_18245 [Dyella halodurans]|uniref:Uncharacterized protein n=1 Tax=Dyella halodurans TaxID=1920171 RepID=A0ABV9C8D1_9GAMM|nr:hypothetical protein [Dyella halodurans]